MKALIRNADEAATGYVPAWSSICYRIDHKGIARKRDRH